MISTFGDISLHRSQFDSTAVGQGFVFPHPDPQRPVFVARQIQLCVFQPQWNHAHDFPVGIGTKLTKEAIAIESAIDHLLPAATVDSFRIDVLPFEANVRNRPHQQRLWQTIADRDRTAREHCGQFKS